MNDKNIMYNYSAGDHRRRLENIRLVEKTDTVSKSRHLVTDYIRGQFVWQSDRFSEKDEELIKYLANNGIGMIQLWEKVSRKDHAEGDDPNEWEMHLGQRMYRPYDAELCANFIDTAHKYGIKVLPYTSTNFYRVIANDFDTSWALPREADLCGVLAHCSAASPKWRERILRQYTGILDEFGFDGVYIDTGYTRPSDYMRIEPHYLPEVKLAEDEVLAFEENASYDGAMGDLLALIYGEVKSRGGIVKIHKEGIDTIRTDMRVYDYLWVGECITDLDFMRKKTCMYRPYVVPDFNYKLDDDDERYLHSIPYMQFPVVRNGTMGIGSPDADRPDFERQLEWLSLYTRITEFGTWCYIDCDAPAIILQKGKNTVVSLFVNREIYIVAANYGYNADTVSVAGAAQELTPDGEGEFISGSFDLPGRKLRVFRYVGSDCDSGASAQARNIESGLIDD